MPFVTSRSGHRLHYRVIGDAGPWVVLVQGIGLSSHYWFDLPERLLAQRNVRILLPDNRGTGHSDVPKRYFPMAQMGDDLADVMAHAGADGAYLFGISLGGMVALHTAIDHGERLAGLGLLATTPGVPYGRLPGPRNIGHLLRVATARNRGDFVRALLEGMVPGPSWEQATPRLEEWATLAKQYRMTPRALVLQFLASVTHSVGHRLHRITVPTVVITGDQDLIIPPVNSKVLVKRIANAELQVIPGVGHVIPIQRPDVIMNAFDRLWARSRADALPTRLSSAI